MIKNIYIFIIICCIDVFGKPSKDDKWIPKLTLEDLNGYTLASRIPLTHLFKLSFYRDVSILFYSIPEDVEFANLTFIAHEEKLNLIGGSCIPQDIEVYLKMDGFPIVNPVNMSFPEDFIDNNARNLMHKLKFKSDDKDNYLLLKHPKAGDWFGAAFISWSDPQANKISQQGISVVCDTMLYTDLRIKKRNVSTVFCDEQIEINLRNTTEITRDIYKCYINKEPTNNLINLSVISNNTQRQLLFRIQSSSIPDAENYLIQCVFSLTNKTQEDVSIQFLNNPFAWHYLEVVYGNDTFIDNFNLSSCEGIEQEKGVLDVSHLNYSQSIIDLVRDTKTEYFTFEYNLPPNVNEHNPTLLNLTSGHVTTMKFNIFPVQDIGGTLSLGVTLKMDLKYYAGYKRRKTNSSEFIFSEKDQFFKVVVCTELGRPLVPNLDDTCGTDLSKKPALIVVNSTESDSVSNIIHIPYPETGTWYVTLALFCDKETVCPCKIVKENNVTNYLVNANRSKYEDFTNLIKVNESYSHSKLKSNDSNYEDITNNLIKTNDSKYNDIANGLITTTGSSYENFTKYPVEANEKSLEEIRIGSNSCNVSVIFSISSASCLGGKCGVNGACNYYQSGGFIYSSCRCKGGYSGWDCSNTANIVPGKVVVMSVLFLTLSNLAFIPSIIYAVRRKYFTEGLVYFFTMFFSSFYHACDVVDSNYSLCVVRLDVLQYCDFFCGLLSFWVTLIAMASLDNRLVSFLHMFGCVMIAFGTEMDKQALLVFLIPVMVGIFIVMLGWSCKCRKTRKMFPAKAYLMIYMPLGVILACSGLICYAFLQTNANYHVVHSIWHMIIAMSVLCLLPNKSYFIPKS